MSIQGSAQMSRVLSKLNETAATFARIKSQVTIPEATQKEFETTLIKLSQLAEQIRVQLLKSEGGAPNAQ